MSAPTLNHRLAAILAADVVEYSKHIAQDEQATIAALELARDAFRVKVSEFRGRIVDMSGDAVLACFGASTDAVSAAIGIQSELSKTNNILRFRVGIATGDVIEKPNGTVYGNGVNIAARLESISNPQGIRIDGAT